MDCTIDNSWIPLVFAVFYLIVGVLFGRMAKKQFDASLPISFTCVFLWWVYMLIALIAMNLDKSEWLED